MPTSGGIGNAVRNGHAIGCRSVQVFTSSPQQWRAKEITDSMIEAFRAAKQETGIAHIVSHDSYLINLCAPSEELCAKSKAGLIAEMDRCARYGIDRVVSHMGAHMGQGESVGIERIAGATTEILEETSEKVTLLMETTAGQGTCLGHSLDQLAEIMDRCSGHPRLQICVDTCHVFAAGYDIRTPEGYEDFWSQFDSKIGRDRLGAIHVNDSKKPLGSRVDRHAAIGEGELGLEPFRLLVNDPNLQGIPMIIETPEAETMHATNLARLQAMVAA